jgi:hypothetical protein
MAIAVALDPNANRPYVQGRDLVSVMLLTFSGNYATNGDTLNHAGLETQGTRAPYTTALVSLTGSGYWYNYIKGTSVGGNFRTNALIKIFAPGGVEVGAGAYPGAVTGDTVQLYALYRAPA